MLTIGRRTSFRMMPRSYKVPTQKELCKARIAGLQRLAEQLGLSWGGLSKGNVVTVLFGKGRCELRSLPEAEEMLTTWQRWSEAGDMLWFEWNTKVYNKAA